MTRFPLGFEDGIIAEENRLPKPPASLTTTSALPGTSGGVNATLSDQPSAGATAANLQESIARLRKRINALKMKWGG